LSHDGHSAARSGAIVGGNSVLSATVSGPGTLTFWWKVSCQSNGSDRLKFYLNGNKQTEISGEVDWQFMSYAIPATANLPLEWRYQKDSSIDAGEVFSDPQLQHSL
jgi:hypothetical protein